MVWSKELARLKSDLKAQDGNVPAMPLPAAKPVPPPAPPRTLEEEDALFLTAVGKPKFASHKFLLDIEEQGEFEEAMSQLKGIKQNKPDLQAVAQPEDLPVDKPEDAGRHLCLEGPKEDADVRSGSPPSAEPPDEPKELPEKSVEVPEAKGPPEKIQLAAGMTIEVDGQLDLRNHCDEDAHERLKERVMDGFCLGWRSLHVVLGNSDSLHQVLADYIGSPHSGAIAKYAQAPIPMGGEKAWILYYEHQ